ncbi:preprotein translocase subunit SecD [Halostella litorea]|uniref:preprotein translocase subunit SecD n=1 Tax=Halostella litorea TaxID=2528831 RepID=UPI001092A57A|nr:preprotein translocase subunit SecD [Halostella litorea]
MSALRENWRIVMLVVLLALSAVALFVPGGVVGGGSGGNQSVGSDGLTNLQYGIELDGGARIRAPPVGMTAEDAEFETESAVERQVANELGVRGIDVRADRADGTVEVFNASVSEEEFAAALEASGVSYGEIRDGVTEETRQGIVDVVNSKISESGLAGGTVTQVTTASGEHYIVVEAPNRDRQELRNLLSERGDVRIDARYPVQVNGSTEYRTETVLQQEDLQSVGQAQANDRNDGYHVSVTLREGAAEQFSNTLNEAGFTEAEGISNCQPDAGPNGTDNGYCLQTVVDGEVVYSAGVRRNLATSIRNGDFNRDPTFRMTTTSQQDAQDLQINLRAGRLPAPLDFDEAQESYVEPSLADQFKTNSLITGIIAVIAVSLTVYFRYGNVRVAAPMVVTALSEVVILLGFSAAVQYPLDLSVIAGFIAVIGTGVDDLIIIADEVMSEGDVDSSRVFQNRFRRAFWVIGAAAATTIVAMSPLAVLSLGDLQGFAIITILGVIVGVVVTRPAYGDILRSLLTDR